MKIPLKTKRTPEIGKSLNSKSQQKPYTQPVWPWLKRKYLRRLRPQCWNTHPSPQQKPKIDKKIQIYKKRAILSPYHIRQQQDFLVQQRKSITKDRIRNSMQTPKIISKPETSSQDADQDTNAETIDDYMLGTSNSRYRQHPLMHQLNMKKLAFQDIEDLYQYQRALPQETTQLNELKNISQKEVLSIDKDLVVPSLNPAQHQWSKQRFSNCNFKRFILPHSFGPIYQCCHPINFHHLNIQSFLPTSQIFDCFQPNLYQSFDHFAQRFDNHQFSFPTDAPGTNPNLSQYKRMSIKQLCLSLQKKISKANQQKKLIIDSTPYDFLWEKEDQQQEKSDQLEKKLSPSTAFNRMVSFYENKKTPKFLRTYKFATIYQNRLQAIFNKHLIEFFTILRAKRSMQNDIFMTPPGTQDEDLCKKSPNQKSEIIGRRTEVFTGAFRGIISDEKCSEGYMSDQVSVGSFQVYTLPEYQESKLTYISEEPVKDFERDIIPNPLCDEYQSEMKTVLLNLKSVFEKSKIVRKLLKKDIYMQNACYFLDKMTNTLKSRKLRFLRQIYLKHSFTLADLIATLSEQEKLKFSTREIKKQDFRSVQNQYQELETQEIFLRAQVHIKKVSDMLINLESALSLVQTCKIKAKKECLRSFIKSKISQKDYKYLQDLNLDLFNILNSKKVMQSSLQLLQKFVTNQDIYQKIQKHVQLKNSGYKDKISSILNYKIDTDIELKKQHFLVDSSTGNQMLVPKN